MESHATFFSLPFTAISKIDAGETYTVSAARIWSLANGGTRGDE
jgi:hypothetical protein